MSRAKLYLHKKKTKRLEQGQPWVYAGEIERMEGEAEPGAMVDVLAANGRYLVSGYWNPASQIRVRVISRQPEAELDEALLTARLLDCKAHRERFLNEPDCRLVYGEADYLPGLVVDRFADVLVVQILTLGMDLRRDELVRSLVSVFQPKGIYERSDVGVRKLEGLEERTGVLYGDCPRIVEIVENGIVMEVDLVEGQKTGYFYDQRENRASIAPLMKGWGARSGIALQRRPLDELPEGWEAAAGLRSVESVTAQAASAEGSIKDASVSGETALVPVNRSGKVVTYPLWDGATVLECFAHTGSFTLHACKYGAKKVTCLDVSDHAIETARRNVERNGFSDRVEFVVDDAFQYLRQQAKGLEERAVRASGAAGGKPIDTSKPMSSGRTWDVVILDPPAFAKTKGAVEGACRGYKDINLHGMKLVNEGGYLVTASCSYHMKPELFLETIQEAAADAGKSLRLIEWRAAGKDHPQLLGVAEGHYLKFAVFEVRSLA
ncbi:class I SAM-dependent rRNA methyltransferase [Paenibacillus pasadenensis]|uniref:class I SAM-dependent rRNA methyltransferase n=1 Tax=Paenibacillus pasadenensis TaxID=217090 RepID=UPI002040BE2F|nr:class I SAM-dependent rRNA methyltransferase [Paenibacillus pasadenensis]MCM3746381.1 class I SAM-dependent rRNA methyltransferase [Paenibacillus pasadenensis]